MILHYRPKEITRSYRMVDKIHQANSGKIVSNHPQSTLPENSPSKSPAKYEYSSLKSSANDQKMSANMSPSLENIENSQQRCNKLPKLTLKSSSNHYDQQQSETDVNQQQILAERARQFVSRVKKQKQYNYGKLIVLKRKQQQIRKNKMQQEHKIQNFYEKHLKDYKFNKLIDNILFHEERISQRIRQSIDTLKLSRLRSKTEEVGSVKPNKDLGEQKYLFEQMGSSRSNMRFSPASHKEKFRI